ncbi:alkaline phosphatase family protein [Mucilaginibacter sp.]|uniref:alkaline phosphatase family protein n=1 Tax=Mucilaginibacter sp. TaxID=1882438 RepID=UPI0026201E0C|nr:alkaline phosphatase family protein [Mucilaginibacter sp.]MDB5030864.1 Phosphoesterase family protein [Mucilaginibacter sp.]
MKFFPKLLCITAISGVGIICFSFSKKPQNQPHRYDHVIVVIEENHGYNALIGSPNAPYINQLANDGALFTDSHGVTHPSQPNYLALFSGSVQNTIGDECLVTITPYTSPNLGGALIGSGLTFNGYAETMPSAGYLPCNYKISDLTHQYLYARKHVPWANWLGNKVNGISPALSLPMDEFPKDFDKLPTVAFVIPNMDNDMHNIGEPGDAAAIQRGDKWLKDNLGDYANWAKKHNSLLIVTFDEDDFKPVNYIPTIFAGANINKGKYSEKINHYNLLHTIEAMYNLPVSDTTKATVITDVWKK